MGATTADCKEFLSQNFSFDKKGWKRVSKRKDANGNNVREFSHPNSTENVYVVETSTGLELASAPAFKTSKYAPSSFIFSVMDDPQVQKLGGHCVLISLDDEDNEGTGEYDHLVPALFPKGWLVENEMEETFSVYNTNLSEEDFVVALHDMGFQSDSTVDQQCNGRSGANSPIVLSRAQKKTLTQATQNAGSVINKISKI